MVYANASYRFQKIPKEKHVCTTDCEPSEGRLRYMQSRNTLAMELGVIGSLYTFAPF